MRRTRPGPAGRAIRGRDRLGPRHRAVDRAGRPGAAASIRPTSSRSPRPSRRRAGSAAILAEERRPLLRELWPQLHPLPALKSTPRPQLRPGRRAARFGLAPPGRPASGRSGSPTTGCAGGSMRWSRPRRRAGRSRSRSSPCATGATSCPSGPTPAAGCKGIVHDASGSGQTLFVEPLVAVELGNAWREAQVAERAEVERILDELSAFVGANAAELRETLDALARFDLWSAKARLAAEMDGVRPETVDRPEVVLLGARHPGLSGRVVPIDIRLGDGYVALVVTGPNTGGKTVTLRTLGLLALMHQAGLHLPIEAGGRLPVFRDVFADIGDEQSVAQSLSTFSGHLRSIIRIVGGGRTRARSCCSTSSAPGPTRPRARRWPRRSSTTSSGPAPWSPRRPTTPSSRPTPTRPRRPATPRSSSTSRRSARPTASRSGCPAAARPSRSPSGSACRPTIVADARSRLSESQRRSRRRSPRSAQAEGETSDRLEQARLAEARASEALRAAQEERRAARRERDELVRAARGEAERLVAGLHEEVQATRQALERETVTARDPRCRPGPGRCRPGPAARRRGRRAGPEPVATDAHAWQLGDRARSRTGGWEGRVAALERDGRRATLETGDDAGPDRRHRPRVPRSRAARHGPLEETLAAVWPSGPSRANPVEQSPPSPAPARIVRAGRPGRRPGGPNSCPPARPDPDGRIVARPARGARRRGARAARTLPRRRLAGGPRAGHDHPRCRDRGPARCRPEHAPASIPLVVSVRPGERGEGGDGATLISL